MGLDNVPHFAFQWEEDNSLMYSQFTQAKGFVDQKIDDASGNCLAFPIVLDQNGDPHVSYCGSDGGLKYAKLEETAGTDNQWIRVVVPVFILRLP